MRTTFWNIYILCGFSHALFYVFLMILQTDIVSFPKHHWMIVRHNGLGFSSGLGGNRIVVYYARQFKQPRLTCHGTVGQSPASNLDPMSVRVKCLVHRLAVGQILLPALRVFSVNIIPPMPHTHFNLHGALSWSYKGRSWERAIK